MAKPYRDWWDPRFYIDFWGNFFGGAGDFYGNYRNMRDANTLGADKYFHCKANCEAWNRGFGGRESAEFISESREFLDEFIKRDPPAACNADRAANRFGRSPSTSCQTTCALLRPPGLDPRY